MASRVAQFDTRKNDEADENKISIIVRYGLAKHASIEVLDFPKGTKAKALRKRMVTRYAVYDSRIHLVSKHANKLCHDRHELRHIEFFIVVVTHQNMQPPNALEILTLLDRQKAGVTWTHNSRFIGSSKGSKLDGWPNQNKSDGVMDWVYRDYEFTTGSLGFTFMTSNKDEILVHSVTGQAKVKGVQKNWVVFAYQGRKGDRVTAEKGFLDSDKPCAKVLQALRKRLKTENCIITFKIRKSDDPGASMTKAEELTVAVNKGDLDKSQRIILKEDVDMLERLEHNRIPADYLVRYRSVKGFGFRHHKLAMLVLQATEKALLQMIQEKKDDPAALKRGLNEGTFVGQRTALHVAAFYDLADAAYAMLNYGADPQAKDRTGNIPLDLSHGGQLEKRLATLSGNAEGGFKNKNLILGNTASDFGKQNGKRRRATAPASGAIRRGGSDPDLMRTSSEARRLAASDLHMGGDGQERIGISVEDADTGRNGLQTPGSARAGGLSPMDSPGGVPGRGASRRSGGQEDTDMLGNEDSSSRAGTSQYNDGSEGGSGQAGQQGAQQEDPEQIMKDAQEEANYAIWKAQQEAKKIMDEAEERAKAIEAAQLADAVQGGAFNDMADLSIDAAKAGRPKTKEEQLQEAIDEITKREQVVFEDGIIRVPKKKYRVSTGHIDYNKFREETYGRWGHDFITEVRYDDELEVYAKERKMDSEHFAPGTRPFTPTVFDKKGRAQVFSFRQKWLKNPLKAPKKKKEGKKIAPKIFEPRRQTRARSKSTEFARSMNTDFEGDGAGWMSPSPSPKPSALSPTPRGPRGRGGTPNRRRHPRTSKVRLTHDPHAGYTSPRRRGGKSPAKAGGNASPAQSEPQKDTTGFDRYVPEAESATPKLEPKNSLERLFASGSTVEVRMSGGKWVKAHFLRSNETDDGELEGVVRIREGFKFVERHKPRDHIRSLQPTAMGKNLTPFNLAHAGVETHSVLSPSTSPKGGAGAYRAGDDPIKYVDPEPETAVVSMVNTTSEQSNNNWV